MDLDSQGFSCTSKLPFSAMSPRFASDKLWEVCVLNERRS